MNDFCTFWSSRRRRPHEGIISKLKKFLFSSFSTDRKTAYTRSSPARWDGNPTNIHPSSTRYPWTKQPMAADKDPSVSLCILKVWGDVSVSDH
ncbi:hypothetical protein M5K25_021352 [Dendrobium thyrsiflorum]|uniref:Uncharacterized protein n=1 Tax=Dendrobium thyrsiflorum TaxID=117978 RepID=A0ABD0UJ57_DENTH